MRLLYETYSINLTYKVIYSYVYVVYTHTKWISYPALFFVVDMPLLEGEREIKSWVNYFFWEKKNKKQKIY